MNVKSLKLDIRLKDLWGTKETTNLIEGKAAAYLKNPKYGEIELSGHSLYYGEKIEVNENGERKIKLEKKRDKDLSYAPLALNNYVHKLLDKLGLFENNEEKYFEVEFIDGRITIMPKPAFVLFRKYSI